MTSSMKLSGGQAHKVHETTTFLFVTLLIFRFEKKFTHRLAINVSYFCY